MFLCIIFLTLTGSRVCVCVFIYNEADLEFGSSSKNTDLL